LYPGRAGDANYLCDQSENWHADGVFKA